MKRKVLIRSIKDGKFCSRQELINEMKEITDKQEIYINLEFIEQFSLEGCNNKLSELEKWEKNFLPVIEALDAEVSNHCMNNLKIYIMNNSLIIKENNYVATERRNGTDYVKAIIKYFREKIKIRKEWLEATEYEVEV